MKVVVTHAEPKPGVTKATIHPANAQNKMVSMNTNVLDGRPWHLASAIIGSRRCRRRLVPRLEPPQPGQLCHEFSARPFQCLQCRAFLRRCRRQFQVPPVFPGPRSAVQRRNGVFKSRGVQGRRRHRGRERFEIRRREWCKVEIKPRCNVISRR